MRHNNNGLSELCDCSRCRGPGRAEGDRTRMVADPRIGRKALLTNAVRTGKEAVQFSGLQGSKTFSSQELAPGGLAGCSGEGGRILYGEDRQPEWVGIQSSITLSRSPPVDPAWAGRSQETVMRGSLKDVLPLMRGWRTFCGLRRRAGPPRSRPWATRSCARAVGRGQFGLIARVLTDAQERISA